MSVRANAIAQRLIANRGEAALRRELYFFTLYRVLEAGLLALLTFSPVGGLLTELRHPVLAKTAAITYLLLALLLLIVGRRPRLSLRRQTAFGVAIDIGAALIAMHALAGVESGVALLLLFNVGAAALFLSLRTGLGFAIAAAIAVMGEYVFSSFTHPDSGRPLVETVMFAVTYLATAVLCYLLGRQMREAQALVERRGEELANLAEVNELIIRRMRTGVLAVDEGHRIRMANEAAWYLLGNPSPDRRDLADVAAELSRRLWHWRNDKKVDNTPLALAEDRPEVIPRFTRLGVGDELFLLFLDDTSLFSRRAEELTLSTMGRLSASIAHEIRNPLASISYSAQLLDESEALPEADRRLLEIIHTQCQRMNGIVQNILGLARRERSQPETLDLVPWAQRFVDEYRVSHPLETDQLQAVTEKGRLNAMVDPQHLQQVLTVLIQNALTYGRLPGEPARVKVAVRPDGPNGPPSIEVIDRGPGIPAKVALNLFQPFYTTHEHGTGLGLYIARQLCEANQAMLSYEPVPGGGSCFRIVLPRVHALVADGAM